MLNSWWNILRSGQMALFDIDATLRKHESLRLPDSSERRLLWLPLLSVTWLPLQFGRTANVRNGTREPIRSLPIWSAYLALHLTL